MNESSCLLLRRMVRRDATHHALAFEVAMGMHVAALIGWLAAGEAREHREQDAAGAVEAGQEEQDDA